MSRTHQSQSRTQEGFTLVELLVVIGIIAVLIGILLPAMGRAREQAQAAQCMSNLRTIGQGLQLYATANRDSLPWAQYWDPWYASAWDINSQTASWPVKIASVLYPHAQGENFYNTVTTKAVFKCPSANLNAEAAERFILHYTCHPRLMPNWDAVGGVGNFQLKNNPQTGKPDLPYKFAKVRNSSEIILIFDGSQYFSSSGMPDGNAHPAGNGLDNWRSQSSYSWGSCLLTPPPKNNSWDNFGGPVDNNVNADVTNYSGPQQQNIRYRHRRNNVANALFVDGHVGQFQFKGVSNSPTPQPGKTDLTRKNIWVNWQ